MTKMTLLPPNLPTFSQMLVFLTFPRTSGVESSLEGVGRFWRGLSGGWGVCVCVVREGDKPQVSRERPRNTDTESTYPVCLDLYALQLKEPVSVSKPAGESHGCLHILGTHVSAAFPRCQEHGLVQNSPQQAWVQEMYPDRIPPDFI